MKLKQYDAQFKALTSEDGTPTGEFEAIVAVFDNVDRAGDRLKSTAFDATLKAWRESGDPIPVILSHKWDDPMAIIGHADPNEVKAIPGRGLYVKGQLHVGRGNEVADQVYHLMSERLIREFSFGYTVPQGGEKKASDGAYDISAVNLIELGPCLKGVNPSTELLAVKSLLAVETPRTKSYVDVKVQGSYEEAQDRLRDALRASYPSGDSESEWTSVSVVATTPDAVTYQVYTNGDESLYRAPYTIAEDGSVDIGEPTEVGVSITPKADEDIETKSDTLEAPPAAEAETEEPADDTPDADADIDIQIADAQIALAHARLGDSLDPEAIDAARLDDELARRLADA